MSDAGEQRPVVPRALVVRRALASAASLSVVGLLFGIFGSPYLDGLKWLAPAGLMATPVVAAASIWSRRLDLQLLARGIWWSLLLFGSLLAFSEPTEKSAAGIAVASAAALLLAGRRGLEDGGGRFQPVAFRGTLMLALVLAMADTTSFLWFGIAQLVVEHQLRLLPFVPPMIAGVIGLLRLRTWGLLVSLACNVLVAGLASAKALDLPDELRWLFIGTAVAQLLVPMPMWITIIRRRPPPPDRWQRSKAIVVTAVIVGIALTSVYFSLFHQRSYPPYPDV